MSYEEAINWLYHTLPMFSRIGAAAYKKDLGNTIALCEALDNPQHHFKSIHIAGTNGKGSVSHMLAAILQKAGYKTGLYTSPHLKDFRERIRINGEMCSKEFVARFTQKMKSFATEIQPSFFEITVAMAFEYFLQEKVDIAVIETGLGGRLDSTNIITPELSIITNIGLDHTYLLGDTLAKIATEKAGIIKQEIPVVIGEIHPDTKPVFEETAHSKQAPIIFAQERFRLNSRNYQEHFTDFFLTDIQQDKECVFRLDLPGAYQSKNLITTLSAIQEFKNIGWQVPDEAISDALANVKNLTELHGRWETIQEHPSVILDVGHNEDGIKQIIEQLKYCTYQNLRIVFGMVKDKDISTVLSLLPKEAIYYFTQATIERALPVNELSIQAAQFGLKGTSYPTVQEALNQAKKEAIKDDLVLVCGSVFIVAEA